jgi:hypothetical protein
VTHATDSTRGLALATLIAGIIVLAISQIFVALHLQSAHPLDGAYGNEPLIAFELARTPEELERVIGANPPDVAAAAVRTQMDRANRIDFAYMACYATFIALSCMLGAVRRARSWLLIGVLIGFLAALFDVAENIQLLQLTQPDADVGPLLRQLHMRTLQKWELLALVGALFAAAFIARGRIVQSVVAAAIALLLIGSGVMTLIDPAKFGASLLWSIALVWLWQIAYSGQALLVRRTT